MTSTRLSTEFNETLQCDLLFIGAVIILHMIDDATRYSAGRIVESKRAEHLIPALIEEWFRLFGPPTTIISDQEGGLCSEEAAIAFERWHVSFRPKPLGTHAYIAERHNDILRRQWLHIKTQAEMEGLTISPGENLSEALFAKNVMLQVHESGGLQQ